MDLAQRMFSWDSCGNRIPVNHFDPFTAVADSLHEISCDLICDTKCTILHLDNSTKINYYVCWGSPLNV